MPSRKWPVCFPAGKHRWARGLGLWQTSAVILQGGREPARPSGLPARAGPSCLLPRGTGPTPRRGQGPPRARTAGEQSEPREGHSPVQGHPAPCWGPCWASGARSHPPEIARGGLALTPHRPALAHLPRSHPGQQPSCSKAQTSGHGARGVPMPRAPARRHAAHSLHCRRRGEEAVPGGRRAPPPAHPLFLVGETHSAQRQTGERSGDTGRGRRRRACPPGPGRLSALAVFLPLPEAGSPLGRGRVFCAPSPGQPSPLWAQIPVSACLNHCLLEPLCWGQRVRGRPLPCQTSLMVVGNLPDGGGWRGSGLFPPGAPATSVSRPTQGAGPLPTPSVVLLGLHGWGAFGLALRRPQAVGGEPHFHLFPPAEAS